jgi:hypothetical protein
MKIKVLLIKGMEKGEIVLAGKITLPFIDVLIFITWNNSKNKCECVPALPHYFLLLFQVINFGLIGISCCNLPANRNPPISFVNQFYTEIFV